MMSNYHHVSHPIVSAQQRAPREEVCVLTLTMETAHQWTAWVVKGALLRFASSLENNLGLQQWLVQNASK